MPITDNLAAIKGVMQNWTPAERKAALEVALQVEEAGEKDVDKLFESIRSKAKLEAALSDRLAELDAEAADIDALRADADAKQQTLDVAIAQARDDHAAIEQTVSEAREAATAAQVALKQARAAKETAADLRQRIEAAGE